MRAASAACSVGGFGLRSSSVFEQLETSMRAVFFCRGAVVSARRWDELSVSRVRSMWLSMDPDALLASD